MTPRIAAIFDVEPAAIVPVVKVAQARGVVARSPSPQPIVEGSEHFSIWVADDCGDWPEFIPGYHFDFRQPSRLHGLCVPQNNKGKRDD